MMSRITENSTVCSFNSLGWHRIKHHNPRYWPFMGLTHWGRVTHICVSYLNNICSDNGLSPAQRLAIICTSAGILLSGPIWTKFSEISIEINTFSFNKMHLKMSSGGWRLFRLGLNGLTIGFPLQIDRNAESVSMSRRHLGLRFKLNIIQIVLMPMDYKHTRYSNIWS